MHKIVLIILCTTILLIILFYIPYININYFKINSLLKDRIINSIDTKPHLLDYPLKEFMINSSHNTYISSIQNLSWTSRDSIKFALEAGVRCIELDINYVGESMPVVAHGNDTIITTIYTRLDKILDCVFEHGFKTSDPLIIWLDMSVLDNDKLYQNIADIFKNKFGDKIITFAKGTEFYDIPIKFFLNKVIIVGRWHGSSSVLENVINHFYIKNNNPFNKIEQKDFNALTRIYPSTDASLLASLSYNMDYDECKKNNYNLIALNYQCRDKNLYKNLLFFKDYSFIHKSEL